MKKAVRGNLAVDSTGSRKQHPAATMHHAMLGNVARSRFRRPNVSIVQIAGNANRKLISPKPQDARRVAFVL